LAAAPGSPFSVKDGRSGKPGRPRVDKEIRALSDRTSDRILDSIADCGSIPMGWGTKVSASGPGSSIRFDIPGASQENGDRESSHRLPVTLAEFLCGESCRIYPPGLLGSCIVLNERHLKKILSGYFEYYHKWRTHLSLNMDCPEKRLIQSFEQGNVIEFPEVGGLHHRYVRKAA